MRLALSVCLLLAASTLFAGVTDEELQPVLATWREYQMPEPPQGASLVLAEFAHVAYVNGVRQPGRYGLLWQLPDTDTEGNSVYLSGTTCGGLPYGWKRVDFALLEKIKVSSLSQPDPYPSQSHFEVNDTFAMGLQLWAAGHTQLGRDLVQRALESHSGHRFSGFYQPPCESPALMVPFVIWAHFGNLLVQPETDRRDILNRMQKAYDTFQQLKLDHQGTDWNANLLTALKATLEPTHTEPGTIEAAVSDLVECSFAAGPMAPQVDDLDFRYLAVLEFGFDAVPALIAHLDDPRLTRSVMQGFNNMPPYIRRVSEVASDALRAIAGDDLGVNWLSRQNAWPVEREVAERWWQGAQVIGEKTHLAARLESQGEKTNVETLAILARRHPELLRDHYVQSLETGKRVGHHVAELIAHSGLSDEQKADALEKGAASDDLEVRWSALRQLHAYDEDQFVAVLVKTLDSFGARATGPAWNAIESRYTHVVLLTERQEAWDALLRATKRAEPRLRTEYMSPLSYAYVKDRPREQRLKFLASFVNDETLRVGRGAGPGAAMAWDRIRVGDYATMLIGSILGIEPHPEPEWR
jgi:hypothetical protein